MSHLNSFGPISLVFTFSNNTTIVLVKSVSSTQLWDGHEFNRWKIIFPKEKRWLKKSVWIISYARDHISFDDFLSHLKDPRVRDFWWQWVIIDDHKLFTASDRTIVVISLVTHMIYYYRGQKLQKSTIYILANIKLFNTPLLHSIRDPDSGSLWSTKSRQK